MDDFAGQQKLLVSMGFTDRISNFEALAACNGHFHAAVEYLTNPTGRTELLESQKQQYKPRENLIFKEASSNYIFPKLASNKQQKVDQITNLGFDDEGKIRNALSLSDWKVETAVGLLVEDVASLRSDFSSTETIQTLQTTHKNNDNYSHNRNGNDNRSSYQFFIFPKVNPQQEEAILNVAAYGFDDEGKIRHALTVTNWNVEQAISKMLDDLNLKSDFSALNLGDRMFDGDTISSQPVKETNFRLKITDGNPENSYFPENKSKFHTLNEINLRRGPAGDTFDRYDIFRSDEARQESSIFNTNNSQYFLFECRFDGNIGERFLATPKYEEIEKFDPFADPVKK